MIIKEAFCNILRKPIKIPQDGCKITEDGRTLPGFQEVTVAASGIGISDEDQKTI
jgi:signal transduction histidine kinase